MASFMTKLRQSYATPQSFNRYSYVRNEPVNSVDPTGLDDCPDCTNNPSDPLDRIITNTNDHSGGGDPTVSGEMGLLQVKLHDPGVILGGDPQRPKATPTPKPACSEQDFNFSEGAGGFSAQELGAIAQTAVGEAGNTFSPNEVEGVIGTIGNRLNINRIYAAQNAGYFPFNGGTSVVGILQAGYDAHKIGSGQAKLNQEKAQNGGVLPADSYVCDQLLAAKNFAKQLGGYDANDLAELYPYTYNLGIQAPLPNNAFGVVQIGNTRFFNRPFR